MESADADGLRQWLATLSRPELDLLISLREFAVARAGNTSYSGLDHIFHLRTLRALGIVLLECSKHRLIEASVDPSIFDRLALLSDTDADFTESGGDDSEVVKPNEDQQTPIDVEEKTKSDASKIEGDDSKVVKPNEDQQTPIGVEEKTKSDASKNVGDDSKVAKPNKDQQTPIGVKEKTESDARLALLSDSNEDFSKSEGDDSKVAKPNKDQQTPIDVKEKTESDARYHEEFAQCQKKRKMSCDNIAMTVEQTHTEVINKVEVRSLQVAPL